MQVLSATRGLAAEAQVQMKEHQTPLVQLFVPILVTSGPLLWAQNTNDGVHVQETTKALLTAQFPPDGSYRSIWVVQESYLPNLVADAEPVPGLNL